MGSGVTGAGGPRPADALSAAASPANATPPAKQSGGNQALAQIAGRPTATSTAGLKNLARAQPLSVKQAIGEIASDLKHVFHGETMSASKQAGASVSQTTTSYLVNAGIELQRSADFKNQGQAKTWALRVLCWVGSVVTLGALPGLAKLIAPKSNFADSLSRYLLGNDATNGDKLVKFNQLFEKFNKLHELAIQNPNLWENFQHKNANPEALALRDEISQLLLDLGTTKEIPADNMRDFLTRNLGEALKGNKLAPDGSCTPMGDKNLQIDFSFVTEETFNHPETPFNPPDQSATSPFEMDFFRENFTLEIGGQGIASPADKEARDTGEYKEITRKFILDQITQVAAANNLDRVEVLKNFLRTYTGQTASGITGEIMRFPSLDESKGTPGNHRTHFEAGFGDHIPISASIGTDGSCTVSHSLLYERNIFYVDERQDSAFIVPCHVEMAFAYGKSLNDDRPHPIADQCQCSGYYFDVSGMA
jgi:hypothetical protein